MRKLLFLIILLLPAITQAQPTRPALLTQADAYTREHPSPSHTLGLAWLRVTHGEYIPPAADEAIEANRALAWQLLPRAESNAGDFHKTIDALPPDDPWRKFFVLYTYAALRWGHDKDLLNHLTIPEGLHEFPDAPAERAELGLLVDMGWPRNQAALEVISHRTLDSVAVLQDMDVALSREADMLAPTKPNVAAAVVACRDSLRQHYLAMGHRIGERLIALKLLGHTEDAQQLDAAAHKIAWLTNPAELSQLMQRLNADQAWTLLLEPLLNDEVKLVNHPTTLPVENQPQTLTVDADHQKTDGNVAIYTGHIRVSAGVLSLSADQVTLIHDADPKTPAVVTLTGTGHVLVRGLPHFDEGIAAEHLTFDVATGILAFSQKVVAHAGKEPVKYLSCIVNHLGEMRDAHSLLADFQKATTPEKLTLAPRVLETYTDAELPDDARILLAWTLLRPHLEWHAPFAPAAWGKQDFAVQDLVKYADEVKADQDRWLPAAGAPDWMLDDIPRDVKMVLQAEANAHRGQKNVLPDLAQYFWLIKDPQHADVRRAAHLLSLVTDKKLSETARHLSNAIACNNTILTMDVDGEYECKPKQDIRLLIDARAAKTVSFKLYRVKQSQTLLEVCAHIGVDFIFRDTGLNGNQKLEDAMARAEQLGVEDADRRLSPLPPVKLAEADLVKAWSEDVTTLTRHCANGESDLDEFFESANYFGDDNTEFYFRLHKRYRPDDDVWSGWLTDRIVTIPAEDVADPGAYVLVAEANGQWAYAPLVTHALNLTMRRARDGVAVWVRDDQNKSPVPAAHVTGSGARGDAVTNADGAGFVHVFASGICAIVAEKDGRFAIGGFGRVFDGLYLSSWNRDRMMNRAYMRRMDRMQSDEGNIYTDNLVAAAYTDRPTYRPGQTAQFKLILRQLGSPTTAPATRPDAFRDDEFSGAPDLHLLPVGTHLTCTVVDPRGNDAGNVQLTLNDFGTAAGQFALPEEAPVGAYSLRLAVGGSDHVLPQVLAVKYYRRPNFQVHVGDVPPKLAPNQELKVDVSADYFFGKPVAGAAVEARLVVDGQWAALAEEKLALDENRKTTLNLTAPAQLDEQRYALLITVTDDSGRAVTQSIALTADHPTTRPNDLAELPRYLAADKPLQIHVNGKEVRVVPDGNGPAMRFAATNGIAEIRLHEPGWYRISADGGKMENSLFVYGGDKSPDELEPKSSDHPKDQRTWVDLTAPPDDQADDDEDPYSEFCHVQALFDQRRVAVGDTLRVLVYVPSESKVLFTYEGRTVVDYKIVDVKGPYQVVELLITQRDLPNFYLQARVLCSEGPVAELRKRLQQEAQQLARAADALDVPKLRVDVFDPHPARAVDTLKVQLQTAQATYRPGDSVDVKLMVTDAVGHPQQAEISLAAVDQSIFSFGQDGLDALPSFFAQPHPERLFTEKSWRSNDRTMELAQAEDAMQQMQHAAQQSMAKRLDKAQLESAGDADGFSPRAFNPVPIAALPGLKPVGQVPAAQMRSDFRETAAWLPQIRTDASGKAQVNFKLPDSLTAYRLSAVALTQQTQIGVGRAEVKVSKSLAAELFLPRFAVCKDRLTATAMLFNDTDQPMNCDLTVRMEGVQIDPAQSAWKSEPAGEASMLHDHANVPAHGSITVPIALTFEQPGIAKVSLTATDGPHSDGEERTLPVRALGRPREVSLNGSFTHEKKLELPAGFSAENLTLTLSHGDVASAMSGLGYLVDYPYGCVEQTMSRFLPAVVVKHAAQQVPMPLPDELSTKLDDVLKKGLARLYHFQHADGGWGWWESDATNLNMSIYVVDGLARCRLAGVDVDEKVLTHGCEYLRGYLANPARVAGGSTANTDARAWLALAQAGQADAQALAARVDSLADLSGWDYTNRATFALACRRAGLMQHACTLAGSLKNWLPSSDAEVALKLQTALTFDAPLAECNTLAEKLLAQRQGGRWDSTQSTAASIEALAQMLHYLQQTQANSHLTVRHGDRVLLDTALAGHDKPLSVLKLGPADLRGQPVTLQLTSDGNEPISYTLNATGLQQLDQMQPAGDAVKVVREYRTLAGQPITAPIARGQIITVHLTLTTANDQEYLLLEDPRPAGFEYADETLHGSATPGVAHQEFRDDRLCVFFTHASAGPHELVYYLRAQTVGLSHVLPADAYPMYHEKTRGDSGAAVLEIK